MTMIFKYVALLEEIIRKESERNERNRKALESIRLLLHKVDYNSEEVVLSSEEKFSELLASLKGTALTADEKEIAAWIIKIKKAMS